MEIKKELVIKSPPSRVFKAITDPKQLTQWFPDVASLEPKVGGKISFRFSESNSKTISDNQIIEGEIIELEKNKRLVYTWGHPNDSKFPLTQVTWNLESIGIGMTKVTITHAGFIDENILQSYNDVWSWFIGRLSIYTNPTKPVNIGGQLVSAFIPGVDLFAFYRIKKLRKSILYLLLPAFVITGIFLVSYDLFTAYVGDNPDKIGSTEIYVLAMILLISTLVSVLVGVAVTNYYMHKWSEEWNRQFLET